ncbi:MFS transporter [Magnetospira sp. QH-2]|uniref:MFS transporter n=1 Tax=Magnetospira sp. (strain QH-2) TaxID=1288970 RepID=UPI0003E80CC9|nr:MFS transporter [Magnetospira sp. QH-2]CCQ74099.1 MFS general substrate transporter [Magnetospira sp. QH-2]
MRKALTERSPEGFLILVSIAMPLAFATWMALLNNFTIEQAQFTGREIGILQSLREIPGFLSFGVVFVLLILREQRLALVSLLLLGIGTAMTGYFPTEYGLYATTVLMSIGFHYFETVRQSLTLQWIGKERAPVVMGRLMSVASLATLMAFGLIYLAVDFGGLPMQWVYLLGGGATLVVTLLAWVWFPKFPEAVEQHKTLILRRRYWLFYALTFMSGARRQIFVVFAGFLMVEKFGFTVAEMTLMLLANHALNTIIAPKIGKFIAHWGERRALILEYTGLACVFTAYAFVDTAWIAVGLYVIDHLFFAMVIAIKTYFQKIADPADMASTAGVSFSINHIAAVVIPATFGLIWLVSPSYVFLIGAGMAVLSLGLSLLVPALPKPGHEVIWQKEKPAPEAGPAQ